MCVEKKYLQGCIIILLNQIRVSTKKIVVIRHLIVNSEKEMNGLKFRDISNEPPVISRFGEGVNQPLQI